MFILLNNVLTIVLFLFHFHYLFNEMVAIGFLNAINSSRLVYRFSLKGLWKNRRKTTLIQMISSVALTNILKHVSNI